MIYLVIIAGSIVRITESGMGCPDWPKCFDQYIPPTHINQLPDNYQNYYSSKREEKIKRFSSFLTQIGLEEKAILIQEDKSLLYEQPFNVWNTWLEYINRLIGALAGLFIFASFLKSFFAKEKKTLKISLGFSLIILTLFQAWWGVYGSCYKYRSLGSNCSYGNSSIDDLLANFNYFCLEKLFRNHSKKT